VLQWIDESGNAILLVRTDEVVTDRYERYLAVMATHFPDATAAAAVNWHEGANAPDHILSVHSNADISSGSFGITDPAWMRALLLATEAARVEFALSDWSVVVEASHWSGSVSGSSPELIAMFPVPMFDIEIGSSPSSWKDPRAAHAVAEALLKAPRWKAPIVYSLLCVGGIHFEGAFRDGVFTAHEPGFAVSHILSNRWVQAGGYRGPEGVDRIRRCVGTIIGGVNAIVYHDSLKADQKSCLKNLADELSIPLVKHRHLRTGRL
jgi:D-tyrosyl-tRNA(Tyr) deacylase